MNACLLLLLIFCSTESQSREIVGIISDMYTEEILRDACFEKIKENYDILITDQKHLLPLKVNHDSVKRYIIFNIQTQESELDGCPITKKVLFMMEPIRISIEKAEEFSRVYTWDDDMIDQVKYFKYYFPDLMPMIDQIIPYEDKKLSTMIVRNWHPQHRRDIVQFFSSKLLDAFEFYGSPFPNLLYSKCYKGRIAGLNCGLEKINVLKNYRFCFCVENSVHLNGYISEKIFPCFAAGCVPIYWGAPNVEDYIPKECFIDYRDFNTHEELYLFIKNMPKDIYERYLDHIRQFLASDQAKLFSPQVFAQTFLEAVNQ